MTFAAYFLRDEVKSVRLYATSKQENVAFLKFGKIQT